MMIKNTSLKKINRIRRVECFKNRFTGTQFIFARRFLKIKQTSNNKRKIKPTQALRSMQKFPGNHLLELDDQQLLLDW